MKRNRESSEEETLKEVNKVIKEIEAQQQEPDNEEQKTLKNKAKRLITFLPTWFTERRRKQQYLGWLQIRLGELTLQSLQLQIQLSEEELKDNREMHRLDRHVHKWNRDRQKQRYVE